MTADATARTGRVPVKRAPEIVVRPRSGGPAEPTRRHSSATYLEADVTVVERTSADGAARYARALALILEGDTRGKVAGDRSHEAA